MAGSVVKTVKSNKDGIEISITMTSDASGDCDVGTFTAHGFLCSMIVEPEAGANDPTDSFDIALNDSVSLNVLGTAGNNLSNAAGMTLAERYITLASPNTLTDSFQDKIFFFKETLTLVGSNMGNAKVATIKFQFRRRL